LPKSDHRFSEPGAPLSKHAGELLADPGLDILVQQVAKASSAEFGRQVPELAREVGVGFDQPYAAVQLGHTYPGAVEE
jgi:hypothetical protein